MCMLGTRSLLAIVILLVAVGAARSTEYFVDAVTGDDVNGAGTVAAPWRTLTRAHAAPIVAGDVITLAAGVHDVALGESFPITLVQNVMVRGAGIDRTFVRGTGTETLFVAGAGFSLGHVHLADLAIEDGATAVSQTLPNGTDVYVLLERVALRGNAVAVHARDGVGAFVQLGLLNCLLQGNQVGIWGDRVWQGFSDIWIYLYGTTLTGNGEALRGTTVWGNLGLLSVQHSIVQGNTDDGFLNEFWLSAPVRGSIVGEASLAGSNGNQVASPGFLDAASGDPHLRQDAAARDLWASVASWPPEPIPGAWNIPWSPSFAQVPDIDGDVRAGSVDAGCDEVRLPSLHVWGEPSVGSSVLLAAAGPPGGVVFTHVSTGASTPLPTPFGTWLLDPPAPFAGVLPLDPSGHFKLPVTLTPTGAPPGTPIYLQAYVLPGPGMTTVEWLRL